MSTLNLQTELTPTNGTLTLSQTSLNAGLAQIITRCNQSQPITITNVTIDPSSNDGLVSLSGLSSYQGVADATVTAKFSLTSDGQVNAVIKYQLRDSSLSLTGWDFSRSFPNLPISWNYATTPSDQDALETLIAQQKPFVTALTLFDTYYVLSTQAQTDADWNVPLVVGLNFISHLRPQGTLGVLENTFGNLNALTLYGPIYFPQAGESVDPLHDLERVWDRPTAPGIHLQAALGQGLSLGNLSVTNLALRMYTPLTNDWATSNPGFYALYGYGGQLSIPSAGITLDITTDISWNQPNATVYVKCNGASLSKLTQLADLAGNLDLSSVLPKALQSSISTLSQLQLTNLIFSLRTSTSGISIGFIELTVGLPNLTWQTWQNGPVVSNLSCRFVVNTPLSSPTLADVVLSGTVAIEGVNMTVQTSLAENFTLTVWLPDGTTIPLSKITAKYASGVVTPGDLDINSLLASLSSDGSYSFSTTMADQPHPWTISVARRDITISNVTMALSKAGTSAFAGTFSGSAAIDSFALNLDYSLSGDLQLRGTFLGLTLIKMIALVSDQSGSLPSNFDFTIDSLIVLVKKRSGVYSFQAVADVSGLGVLAFEARRSSDGKSGFAVGISLSGSTLSQLGGLQALSAIDSFVTLQKLLVVAATYDDAAFTFPDMASFNQPTMVTKSVTLPSSAGGLKSGFNIFAQWQLRDTNQNERILKTLLGLSGSEQVVIQVSSKPANDTRLMLSKQGKIQGRDFNYVLGVQLTNGSASLFLTGSLTINIQKKPQTFNLTTVFVPSGAFLSASMQGGSAIDCGPFQISNLGLMIGVNASGVPSLGLTANINVQSFSSSIAMFFDSADPSKSLLAGAVSDLTLKDVVRYMLGNSVRLSTIDDVLDTVAIKGTQSFTLPSTLTSDLNNSNLSAIASAFAAQKMSIPSTADQVMFVVAQAGKVWYLTDLTKMRYYEIKKQGGNIVASVEAQLYFAPQATSIGGIVFPMGYYLNAAIEFFGFHAQATVMISQNQGFTVDASADKLVLVNESVFCLSSVDGKSGPQISISTMAQPNNSVVAFRQPHFYINGSLTILGVKQSVLVVATKDGIIISLEDELVSMVDFDLKVTVNKSGFSLSGGITAGVDKIDLGDLGKIDLDTDITATITTSANANTLSFGVDASFVLMGDTMKIAHFNLDTSTPALANIGKTLGDKATQMVKDVFKDADRWVNAVKNGAISDVADTKKVLTQTFGKSAKDADQIAGDIDNALGKGVSTTTKKVTKFVKKIL